MSNRSLSESIVLIGMPGVGKSTVGRLLAKNTGVDFIDTDDLIVANIKMSLQDYISQNGFEKFGEVEEKIVSEFKTDKPVIIATGGSVVLYEKAMENLKSIGRVVFLDADLPLIRKRIKNPGSRGIVYNENSDSDPLTNVYMTREPLYYKYADMRIHIRGNSLKQIQELILN